MNQLAGYLELEGCGVVVNDPFAMKNSISF
jgi:hypothetical protein